MALTLARALSIPPLDQCRVVAGASGLDRVVSSVNVVDAPDQGPWIKGGELLITTGYVVKDSVDEQIRLFRHLNKQGCAGLGVKFKTYLIEPSEPIIREANALGFPLIEIPYHLPFSEIMLCLIREIVNDRRSENERTRSNKFLESLFRGELQGEDFILAEGAPFGLLPGCFYTVLNIKFDLSAKEGSKSDIKLVVTDFVRQMSALSGGHLLTAETDDVTILSQAIKRKNQPDMSNLTRNLAESLIKQFNQHFPKSTIFIGIGLHQSSVSEISRSFRQAQEAVYIGRRIDPQARAAIFEYSALDVYATLQTLPLQSRQSYVSVTLGQLFKHDKQNDHDLVHTLETYLACGRKSLECAKQLHVHRNTIYFRLAKIKELLGVDLDDGEIGFRLQLALHMAKLNETGAWSSSEN